MADLRVARTVADIRELVGRWRASGERIALVPTMGNLHAGHVSLVRLARTLADRVVVSIFVNPTQFGVDEDFAGYPRTLAEDEEKLAEIGIVHALFAPEEREIYPFGTGGAVQVTVPELGDELCGASRPGHFQGVTSVVCRLLNIVAPDILVLGRKDYQQYLLIERMVADLRLPVRVVTGPIERAADGLALSSRNQYLTADERKRAPALHETLERVRVALTSGDADYAKLEAQAAEALAAAGFEPDYVEVRRAADLGKPNGRIPPDDLVVVAAAWLGRARLIDNVQIGTAE